MTARADLPRLEDMPIPADVTVTAGWSSAMREMAEYIGAYDVLRVVAALGGEQIYVSRDPARSPFRDILSGDKVEVMTRIYGGARYFVPTGTKEIRHARRAGVIAAVRAKKITGADGAKICGTSRSHMATLVNQTDEGRGAALPVALLRRCRADPRQIDMFPAEE